jgi:hypothetical protein
MYCCGTSVAMESSEIDWMFDGPVRVWACIRLHGTGRRTLDHPTCEIARYAGALRPQFEL